MSERGHFPYESPTQLQADFSEFGLELPIESDVSALFEPLRWGRLTVPNRLVAHPMEGCDAQPDGSPGELTLRRYERFAAGGAGMLWLEACAVVPEGRANPRQLWLHEANLASFQALASRALAAAHRAGWPRPVLVLQLTHSGRWSRPMAEAAPIIAHRSPVLDARHHLPADYPLITDEQLDALQDAFVASAELAVRAGFDAVDVKASHGYLLAELLAAHTRASSSYGGDYDNRTRMLRQSIAKVRAAVGDVIEVTCRLNAYDAIPHPYGWGAKPGAGLTPDLSEPIRLAGQLRELGVHGLSVTLGIPYYNPHINRPAERTTAGAAPPPEPPAQGLARLIDLTRQMQQAHPELPMVGAGLSWLRQYMPAVAAGIVKRGWAAMAGFGRGAFAYPDFAADLRRTGLLDERKVCIACSACTQMMRDGGQAGCVVRDSAVYGPIYRAGRARARAAGLP